MTLDNYKVEFTNFRNQYFTVEELLEEKRSGHLKNKPKEFTPGFSDWNVEQKSRFVESLVVGQPHPAFFIDGSLVEWYLIDGEKRLRAVSQFVLGKYRLCGLYFLGDKYEDKAYGELPLFVRRKIMNYVFEAYILNPGSSPQVRYGVYTNLLARPLKNVSNPCRQFLFPAGFALLSEAASVLSWGLLWRPRMPHYTLRNCSAQDITGRLLVFLLAAEGLRFASSGDINIEVLVNSLLEEPHRLSMLMERCGFFRKLKEVGELVRRVETLRLVKTVEQMDALFALLLKLSGEGRTKDIFGLGEWIVRVWERIPPEVSPTGRLLRDYLKRFDFVYNSFRL